MKTKVLFCLSPIVFSVCSCKSTNISYAKKREIETKINIAVENSNTRSKENCKQFEKLLLDDENVNEYSNELIESLLDNKYVEIDFNKLFNIEIEKILMHEIFHKESDVYLGNTMHKIFIINGIKYFMYYLYEDDKNYPNLYTDIYVYDSKREKIRVFYKINYNLEYEVLSDGINSYKIFY